MRYKITTIVYVCRVLRVAGALYRLKLQITPFNQEIVGFPDCFTYKKGKFSFTKATIEMT